MAILRIIRFDTTAGAPDYFKWGDLDGADYYAITDDGKAYAIWGGRYAGSSRSGWCAAEIQCTEEGMQSNNIWRRLSGGSMSGMESDHFPSKKELISAIENGSITLKDKSLERQAFKSTMKDLQITISTSSAASVTTATVAKRGRQGEPAEASQAQGCSPAIVVGLVALITGLVFPPLLILYLVIFAVWAWGRLHMEKMRKDYAAKMARQARITAVQDSFSGNSEAADISAPPAHLEPPKPPGLP